MAEISPPDQLSGLMLVERSSEPFDLGPTGLGIGERTTTPMFAESGLRLTERTVTPLAVLRKTAVVRTGGPLGWEWQLVKLGGQPIAQGLATAWDWGPVVPGVRSPNGSPRRWTWAAVEGGSPTDSLTEEMTHDAG